MGSGALRFHPRRVGIPPIERGPQKVSEKPSGKKGRKKGVKGMFPLGCFPLWGREGVIFITGGKYWLIIGEKKDFYRALFLITRNTDRVPVS